jgi:hypothetical protein
MPGFRPLHDAPGLVAWLAAALVLLLTMMAPVLPISLPFGVLVFAWVPGIPLVAWLLLKGPPGWVRRTREWGWAWAAALPLLGLAWLASPPAQVAQVAYFILNLVAYLGLAERARAWGWPRAYEAVVGAAGAVCAMVTFLGGSLGLQESMPHSLPLGFVAVVGLQALPLRWPTRLAVGLGIVPTTLALSAAFTPGLPLRIVEAAIVLAYAAALLWAWRGRGSPAQGGRHPAPES